MMDAKKFSRYFKAFGDKTRLRIVALLADKELTVNEIVAAIGLSQPTFSRHLGVLRQAEVVHDRRDGQKVYYSLDKDSVESCCSGFCCCLEIPEQRKKTSKRKKK